jgi:nucleotide-binding universal stress UspA family protein
MSFKKIMACVDFSKISHQVVKVAGELANLAKAQALFVHVVEKEIPILVSEGIVIPQVEIEKCNEIYRILEEKAKETLEEMAKEIEGEWKVEVTPFVLVGEPFDLLLDKAEEEKVDLIVVGSHGKKGVERILLGSVSEKVARKAYCSVLVVR